MSPSLHNHLRGARGAWWMALLALCLIAALWVGRDSLGTARAGTVVPAFVQASSAHSSSVTSLAATPTANVTAGNTMVVEVGVWSEKSATTASVTDSAGNSYVELLHFTASDKTEMSIWAAPISAGGGTKPTITAKPSAKADVGVVALEYSGVAIAGGTTVLDRSAFNTGTTKTAGTVSPGATQATTGTEDLAIGFYLDSGFGDKLAGGSGYTTRANVSPEENVELLAQDAVVTAGSTPNPTFSTGASTIWLASTITLQGGESGPVTAPSAPTEVGAIAGNASANVSWQAPSSGNSTITSYTITPYVGSVAQTPTKVNGSPPATSATVSGLTNGTTYTFTVSATNSAGTGPASSESNAVTPDTKPEGEFTALASWPFVAIHLIQLANGNVLAFDGWQQPEPTYVWNPTTQAFTSTNAPDSIFCSGMAQLPNGEVMTVGGYGGLTTGKIGIVDTAIFNPATGTWSRVADMHTPRWYPDVTELANGDYVAISGNSTNANTWANTPEVYDPTTNTWTELTKVSTSQIKEEEYPFSYLLPSGEVFTIGPSEDLSFELNVANQTWTQVGGASGITNGSSVMYRPGKILYSGGAPSVINTTNSVANTAVIDLTAATPKWQQIAPMHNNRVYHTLTMLANGEVLAVGGEATSDQEIVTSGVLPTEIWNPATEKWTASAPIAAARNYHSTAMLMANGKVLIAGGGHPNGLGDPGEFSAQTYSPPYLFDGPQPTITAAPAASTYNTSITVTTPEAASIGSVNLVSLGDDTHQSDMAQHFVPLSFTVNSGSLTVQTPANSALAPYGNYMLFIVNKKGVPSISTPLNLSPTPTAPAAPTGVSATGGEGSATVTWTAPSPGTSPITSYTVTPYIGSTAQSSTVVNGSPPATSTTIAGLKNGTTYTFTVTATNAVGSGPPSEKSNAVTPSAPTAPAAPAAPTATPGNASATVNWSAPAQQRQPDHQLHGHPLPWKHGPAGHHDQRLAAGDQRHDHRSYQRQHLHIHRDGNQRRRQRPRLARVGRRYALRHGLAAIRATGIQPRPQRHELGRDSRGQARLRQPPDRRGRRLEQRQGDGFEREGLGRRHFHRAAALQGVGQHRNEHLERTGDRRRRNDSHDHRHAQRQGRSRRRRARIRGPVDGGRDCRRGPERERNRHDQSCRSGIHTCHCRDHGTGRADRRLLRRLRLRRQPDGADGLQRSRERLAGRRNGVRRRGRFDRRHWGDAERKRADRGLHDLADERDRVQVRGCRRTAGGAAGRAGAAGRHTRQRRRDRHLDGAAQRR